MTEPNMVPYFRRLTPKEQVVICYLHKQVPWGGGDLHPGVLPFLPVKEVLKTLKSFIQLGSAAPTYARICREILVKLAEAEEPNEEIATFYMRLSTKKVYKHFGQHPERGKPLPFLPKQKVTVGMKWSLPKKQWVPDRDVLVAPCVTLRLKDGGARWEVTVLERCRAAVELWLMQNCQ